VAEYIAAGSNKKKKNTRQEKKRKKREKKLEKPHANTSESFPQAFCLPSMLAECQDQGKSHHFVKVNCF